MCLCVVLVVLSKAFTVHVSTCYSGLAVCKLMYVLTTAVVRVCNYALMIIGAGGISVSSDEFYILYSYS